MSRLAGDMKGFVVLGVYRSTEKKTEQGKNTAMTEYLYTHMSYAYRFSLKKKTCYIRNMLL